MLNNHLKTLIAFLIFVTLSCVSLRAQISLWVGEKYKCDATSAVVGLTSDINWSYTGGSLSMTGSGFYRDIVIPRYFSGSATVTCSWRYRLYSGDTQKTMKKTWTFTCRDNKVSIHPTTLELEVGETGYLGYSHQYDNQYVSYADAYFYSSSSCLSVTKSGTVLAKAEGTGYVNVWSNVSSETPHCTVYVKKKMIPPTGIKVSPSSLTLYEGESKSMTYSLIPDNATATIEWKSSNTSIATVNRNGVVTGIAAGDVSIIAYTDKGLSASADVKVLRSIQSISLSDVILYEGYGITIVPTITPTDIEADLEWSSSDINVAMVDRNGFLIAKKTGTATITAKAGNKSASATVTVKSPQDALNSRNMKIRIKTLKGLTKEVVDN